MEIGDVDKDNPEKDITMKYRYDGGYLLETNEGLLIYGPMPDPVALMKYNDIKSVEIKKPGTLYDGEVVFTLTNNSTLKYKIKSFQLEDFEELKRKLKK